MRFFGCQRKAAIACGFGCYHAVIPHSNPFPLRHRFWRFFYDRVAFAYDAVLKLGDRLHISSEERIRVEVIAGLAFPSGARVLDVGCGTAANRMFLPSDIAYIGIDLSRNMLKLAHAKCARLGTVVTLVQADGLTLPFPKNSASLVIAMGVLQHIFDPQQAVAEFQRVSKTGAQILIIDERRAMSHILPNDAAGQPRRFGEYFVTSLRKD